MKLLTPETTTIAWIGVGVMGKSMCGHLIDMTTSEPSLAAEIHTAAKAKGVFALDAPVSGGDLGARNAALSIMVGGDQEAFDAALPMFEAMGKTIRLHGPAG